MHRRAFLTGVAAPAFLRLPSSSDLHDPTRLMRHRAFASPSGAFLSLGIGVRLHVSAAAAERAVRADLASPFGRAPGEFYPGPPYDVTVAMDLPEHIRRYEAVIGVAAVKRTIIVGAFRRDQFSWSVRIVEGSTTLAVDAGRAIAAFSLPDPLETWLVPALLERLLPAAGDFGGDVVVETDG